MVQEKSIKSNSHTVIKELIAKYDMPNGFMAIDFDDFSNLIADKHDTEIIISEKDASGKNAIEKAVTEIIENENRLKQANEIVFYAIGDENNMDMIQIHKATMLLQDNVLPEATITFGAGINANLKNLVKAVIVAEVPVNTK